MHCIEADSCDQLLNEEGLPFVEIQEFEEDEPLPAASTSALVASSSASPQEAAAPAPSSKGKEKEATKPAPTSAKPRKSVSFAQHDEYEPSKPPSKAKEEEDIPIIASSKAAASAGLSSSKISQATEVERPAPASGPSKPSMTSSFADSTLKPTIVVKDTTKPPPVLTAAERSARLKSKYDVAAEFDGVEAPKKVDLSAYLPRQLRGTPIAATFKGKARATTQTETEEQPSSAQNGDASQARVEDDFEEDDDLMDDSDEDGYYDDDLEDSDDDNTHIDDILAMREAAMEYHAKRHALGAGLGTGPLGGFKGPDAFDEVNLICYSVKKDTY